MLKLKNECTFIEHVLHVLLSRSGTNGNRNSNGNFGGDRGGSGSQDARYPQDNSTDGKLSGVPRETKNHSKQENDRMPNTNRVSLQVIFC